jgi:hypothetical protein
MYLFPTEVLIFNKNAEPDIIHRYKTYISIGANWQKHILTMYGVVNLHPISERKIRIESDSEFYFPFVRLFVAVNLDEKVDEAIENLERYLKP